MPTTIAADVALRMPPAVEPAELKTAMRLFAGQVSVITAGEPGARTGATVTSATALSIDPPTMFVAINRSSSTWPVIADHRHFCVNLLGDAQSDIAGRFAGMGGVKGEDRYAGADWIRLESGAPVLADAMAAIDCVVEELIERHSHGMVLGRVVAIRSRPALPLIYGAGRYGRFG